MARLLRAFLMQHRRLAMWNRHKEVVRRGSPVHPAGLSLLAIICLPLVAACGPTDPPGDGDGDGDGEDTYGAVEALGTAILEAEQARGEDTWLDVARVELPAWAPPAEEPWGSRVQSMLDELNALRDAVVPGEVPIAEAGQSQAAAVVQQALSGCTAYEEDCSSTSSQTSLCTYRSTCGTVDVLWTFAFTPATISDYVEYFGYDDHWDYGTEEEGGFLVQSGLRTRDGKTLEFTAYTNPDNHGPFSHFLWNVDGEATIYTPWGGQTQVFTVSSVSTVYLYDIILETYRPSIAIALEHTVPNGPVHFTNSAWSLSRQAMVKVYEVTFADGECAWASYDDDGNLEDSGSC
jgi:hypothetical protein